MPKTKEEPQLPAPRMSPVNYYGCVMCQREHFEDTDAKLYNEHIYSQSKNGIQQLYETMAERKKRYGIVPAGCRHDRPTNIDSRSRVSLDGKPIL